MPEQKQTYTVHGRVFLDDVEIAKDDPRILQFVKGSPVFKKDLHLYTPTTGGGIRNCIMGNGVFGGNVTVGQPKIKIKPVDVREDFVILELK